MRKKTFLVSVIVSFLVGSFVNAQTSGPAYIKNILTTNAVFDTPSYSFTNEYDAYKEYDNMQGLFIDGLDYDGHATKVWCWYGVPEGLSEGETAPAVVVVHGGGGTAFQDWVAKWNERGYIAIAIAHEGQLPLPKVDGSYVRWEFSGPSRAGFFRDADEDVEEQWFYHAIADAMMANSLLRTFPEVDAANIAINGISWGGVLTNVITGIDDRFKFSVPVYGCGYLYESPKYSVDMNVNTEEEIEFYMNNWEPSLYIPLQDLPVFYVNGDNDKQFAQNIATPSYNLMTGEKYLRIQRDMAHSTKAGYAPEEIYDFADYITQNGTVPLTVTIDNITEDVVTASYTGEIDSAILYYTNDVINWEQDSFTWNEVTAQINNVTNLVTANLPEGEFYYYINVIKADGSIYSSPMEEVIDESLIKTVVDIKAEENYTYNSGAITMTGICSLEDYDASFEIIITVTPSEDLVNYPNAAIVSGLSDNNGGMTSTTNSWGISDDGSNDASGDRIFQGDQGFSATISSATLGSISGSSGLQEEAITINTFKSIAIVNGHNVGDRFTFSANDSEDIELGRLVGESVKVVDLVVEASDTNIEYFTIKNGSTATNDKWAVENIGVQVTVDTSMLTLGVDDVSDNKIESLLSIYPNPAVNELRINKEHKSYKIYDTTGTLVKTGIATTDNSINISELNQGMYIIKIYGIDGKISGNHFIKK